MSHNAKEKIRHPFTTLGYAALIAKNSRST
jgi:hypothetical protein